MDGSVGYDHLGTAGPSPGLGSVGLNQGAVLVVADDRGRPQDLSGQDNPLSAEAGEDDLLF